MGICGLEPQTSSLSVTRSNQLSYIPDLFYSSVFGGKLQGLGGDFGGRGGADGLRNWGGEECKRVSGDDKTNHKQITPILGVIYKK